MFFYLAAIKMNELVSVIVPVYNIESYLPRCLECLKAQTYTNLEIILVDDGSTDGSGMICEEYAACDPRARVIHHDHNIGQKIGHTVDNKKCSDKCYRNFLG